MDANSPSTPPPTGLGSFPTLAGLGGCSLALAQLGSAALGHNSLNPLGSYLYGAGGNPAAFGSFYHFRNVLDGHKYL